MKRVLSLLLAYVFLQTQTWAIGGGPAGAGGIGSSLIGSYAGALLPGDESDTGTVDPTDPNANNQFNGLGLFTLSIPQSGLGTGSFAYFSEGRTFVGTITGFADPSKGTLVGLLKGQFDIVVSNFQLQDDVFGDASLTQTVPGGFANGTIKADFVAGPAVAGLATSLRIEGEATMAISEFKTEEITDDNGTPNDTTDDTVTTNVTVETTSTLNLVVDGFQQSNIPAGIADFSGLTGNG